MSYHSLTIAPYPSRHAGVPLLPYMPGITLMIGDTMVRTILTMTMTGRLDAWKHQSRVGVMS